MKSQYTNSAMHVQMKPRHSNDTIKDTSDTDEAIALGMIRNILKFRINPERLSFGKTKIYTAIRLDEKKHRPVCRLYFDKPKKFIGIVNKRKVETRFPIDNIGDIVNFAKELLTTVDGYDK